jgi:hypothetical protein
MCANSDKNHVEAWKSVIDFCKTAISVSSAILTAILGYYIVSQTELSDSWVNFVPPTLLVIAIALAIWGFGRSIKSVSSGTSQPCGILLANLSIFALLAGILSISLVEIEKDLSLDVVISNIEKESQNTNKQLVPLRVRTVSVSGSIYTITYDTDKGPVKVSYSTTEHRVTGIQ